MDVVRRVDGAKRRCGGLPPAKVALFGQPRYRLNKDLSQLRQVETRWYSE